MNRFFSSITGLLLIIIIRTAFAQAETNWNGYIQTRFNSDLKTHNEFMVRRGKLWLKGSVPNVENLYFKIQAVYRSAKDQSFMVQDVYARYQTERQTLQVGRMVPDFTLQWNQPDATIPVLERGLVVDGLIHGDKSIARLLGIQYVYDTEKRFHLGLGIFNANFNTPGSNTGKSFLYTFRSSYQLFIIGNFRWHIGASFAYRKLNNQELPRIYDSSLLISGDDYRWGFETLLHVKNLEIQGEYLSANINKERVWGYYAYAAYFLSKKVQTIFLIEKFEDLNPVTKNNEYYGAGLNYLLTHQVKIMGEVRTQFSRDKNNYEGRIQFQIFFNS